MVETRDALVCPVFPQLGQNVAQSIRPRAQRRGHSKAAHVARMGPTPQPQDGADRPLSLSAHPQNREMSFQNAPLFPWPTRPHLVMVPSMSEMTTLSSHFHR